MSRNLTAEKNRHPPDCKENLPFPYWPIDVALGIVKAEACRYKCNLRAEFHMLHFKPRPRAGLTETYQATSAAVLGLLYKKTVDLTLTKRTEAAPLPQGHEDVTLSGRSHRRPTFTPVLKLRSLGGKQFCHHTLGSPPWHSLLTELPPARAFLGSI